MLFRGWINVPAIARRLKPWARGAAAWAASGVVLESPAQVPEQPPAPPRLAHYFTVALLLAGALFLFRHHLLGDAVLVGNSDRINTSLNIAEHYIEGVRQGRLSAWDPKMFGGVNTLGLPYISPNPLILVQALAPREYGMYVAGCISCLLFAGAGWAAYAFLFDVTRSWFGATVAAVLYQFSALSTLKINQNDPSFAVLVLIPLLMLAVRRTDRGRLALPFACLAFLFFGMLEFTFLQKAAYAAMLVFAYAGHQSILKRTWAPILTATFALAAGTVGAWPRLVTIGQEMALLQRTESPPQTNARVLLKLFGYQFRGHSKPLPASDLYRLFDYGLYGRWPSEAAERNLINLSEGMYLYSSAFAVFLILLGAVGRRSLHFSPAGGGEYRFHLAAFALVLATPFVGVLNHLMFLAFLGRDFIHYRILIAALLPMCCLTAFLLRDWGADAWSPWRAEARPWWCVAFAAAAVVWAALVAGSYTGSHVWMPAPGWVREHHFVVRPVVRRLTFSVGVFSALLLASQFRVGRVALRNGAGVVLGLLMVFEATWAADHRVNHPVNASAVPFLGGNCGGNILLAEPDQFRPPSAGARQAFADRLETDHYRTVLLRGMGEVPCRAEPHIASFWGMRVIDGYSSGVPSCLTCLPWPADAVLPRSISFWPGPNRLPWPLLSLLNVKYAVDINDGLLRNYVPTADGGGREAGPGDVNIATNPYRVVPRVFFVSRSVPAESAAAAARSIFATGDPTKVVEASYVQGIGEGEEFEAGGPASAAFDGDCVRVAFPPAAADRFLVLNERYHPCWRATVGGRDTPVFQTNAFMQGVRVPAGADGVALRFVPFLLAPASAWAYAVAVLLFVGGWYTFRRKEIASRLLPAPLP